MSSQDDLLQRAYQLVREGNIAQAHQIIGEILKAEPRNADAWYLASLTVNEPEKRIAALERALKADPAHRQAHEALLELRSTQNLPGSILEEESPAAVKPPPRSQPASSVRGTQIAVPWLIGAVVGILLLGLVIGGIVVSAVQQSQLPGVALRPTLIPTSAPTIAGTSSPVLTLTHSPDFVQTATALVSNETTQIAAFNETATAIWAATATSNLAVTSATPIDPQMATSIAATQDARTSNSVFAISNPVYPLNFNVIDAEYSRALDRIIMISTNPDQLHIYDPDTHTDDTIALSHSPSAISLSPDSLYAAVGHNGMLSYINLQTRSIRQFNLSINVADLVLAGNGWVYLSPLGNQSPYLHSLELASGTEAPPLDPPMWDYAFMKLHPDGQKFYADKPDNLFRVNIASGQPNNQSIIEHMSQSGEVETCGGLWLSADGANIFTGCGAIFHSSAIPEKDMIYNTTLEKSGLLHNMIDVPAIQRIIAVGYPVLEGPNGSASDGVYFWDDVTFNHRKAYNLPLFFVAGHQWYSRGLFVFVNNANTEYDVIVRAADHHDEQNAPVDQIHWYYGIISVSLPAG